ncbi:uncharacterized protein LOC134674805 isoform X1 [Cydia fagiglandana]|uniref:uncharacterized protein LOC134674805 isoform X1 n=1 Tax=Cydia fagiglandana TaxID=1458189 RepID=UPI002FEE478A
MFYIVTSLIISCGFLFLDSACQNMLGSGTWSVISTQPCENDAEMPWRVRLRRHKLNRTHDVFDAELTALADIDESFSLRGLVCKVVGGGCKPFIEESRDCLPCIVREHAWENARSVLVAVGIDPPDFPIPKGEYKLDNYMVDTEELSKKGLYGEFQGTGYVVKDGQDIACYQMSLKFEPIDEFGSVSSLYG